MMLSAHEIRAVSVAAECDPRTVKRYLDGKAVRPIVKQRIERAMGKRPKGRKG